MRKLKGEQLAIDKKHGCGGYGGEDDLPATAVFAGCPEKFYDGECAATGEQKKREPVENISEPDGQRWIAPV